MQYAPTHVAREIRAVLDEAAQGDTLTEELRLEDARRWDDLVDRILPPSTPPEYRREVARELENESSDAITVLRESVQQGRVAAHEVADHLTYAAGGDAAVLRRALDLYVAQALPDAGQTFRDDCVGTFVGKLARKPVASATETSRVRDAILRTAEERLHILARMVSLLTNVGVPGDVALQTVISTVGEIASIDVTGTDLNFSGNFGATIF